MAGTLEREAGVRSLFEEHYRSLVRLAALLLDERGAAEEVVQEAFVRLHASWDRVRDESARPAYLRSTVLNLARSGLRRRAVARRYVAPVARPASVEERVVVNEDHREVLAALRALPRRQRECLVLRYYLDLSEAEIAETLGVSAGTVKSSAHRGLAALASKLEALA